MQFPISYQNVLLRSESLSDYHQLKELSDKLVEERAYIGRKEKRSLEDWKINVESAMARINQHTGVALIAEKDSKIVGLASIFMSYQKMDHFGGLGIMLDKSVRGIGLGSKMMEIIIKWGKEHLKGLECIELGVIPENSKAKRLYEKFGFHVVACLPKKMKHFGKYCDEEIMHLWVI